jgi:hypothetical protein
MQYFTTCAWAIADRQQNNTNTNKFFFIFLLFFNYDYFSIFVFDDAKVQPLRPRCKHFCRNMPELLGQSPPIETNEAKSMIFCPKHTRKLAGLRKKH